MTKLAAIETLIPHVAPIGPVPRTILLAIRRLATGGLSDAQATSLFIGTFGMDYRRPLMFLRVLMQEVSRISQRPITIAPCCCPRMTEGEAMFLFILSEGRDRPDEARRRIASVTASLDCLPAVSVAQALADAFDDIGRPFSL